MCFATKLLFGSRSFLLVVLALLFCIPNSSWAENPCLGRDRGAEYLLQINNKALSSDSSIQANQTASIISALGVQSVARSYDNFPGLYHVIANDLDEQSVSQLKRAGLIEYLDQNACFYIDGQQSKRARRFSAEDLSQLAKQVAARRTPNDPRFDELWGLNLSSGNDINAPEAWDLTTGSSEIIVGIVDTGVDYQHEDLQANMWVNPNEIAGNGVDDDSNGIIDDVYGKNCIFLNASPGNPMDDNGHGSHVAGTVSAVGNNGVGVTGVNWNTKIMALKFLDDQGAGFLSDAIDCLDYSVTMKNAGNNVRVLNNSWGGGAPSASLIAAITRTNDANMVFVAAAGNEANNNDVNPSSPGDANVANVISIAAVNSEFELASFSNFGTNNVDFAAPGVSILSTTQNDTYSVFQGTSMASPHVAGVAALVLSREASLSPAQVKQRLMDTVTSVSGLSGSMVSPGVVNAERALTSGLVSDECSPGSEEAPDLPSEDSDGDGVTDTQETSDGTDANDPGSFRVRLQSPVYALWTGFLNITNILELVNVSEESTAVARVELYSISGLLKSSTTVSIAPRSQSDLIINDMDGYLGNSYGLIKITYCGGQLDGRVSYYRLSPAGTGQLYDFVYNIPLMNPQYGEAVLGYNTFQASSNPSDIGALAANWLSIINLSSSSQSYSVRRYSMSGTLQASDTLFVGAKARVDLQGGHEDPGANNVGLIKVAPADSTKPYMVINKRFIYRNDGSLSAAFPLLGKAGTGRSTISTLTTTLNAQSWLEVLNTRDSATDVTVNFRRSDGALLEQVAARLAGNAQVHLDVNSRLGSEQVGYAEIVPAVANSIIAQNMVYLRDSEGSILGMYGSQSREALSGSAFGSFNLYLRMSNWLKITNPSDSDLSVSLFVYNANGTRERSISVPARGSIDLGIHESSTYGTSSDTFGVLQLTPAGGGSLLAELLRIRQDVITGLVDFAAPTAVR